MTTKIDNDRISVLVQRISTWQQGQPVDVVVPFVESIFSLYLIVSEDSRKKIRETVRANRSLWNFAGRDDIGTYGEEKCDLVRNAEQNSNPGSILGNALNAVGGFMPVG